MSALVLASALGLGGCVRGSAPISIGQALRELQRQMLDAGAVSVVGTDPSRFAAAVRQAQCAARQPDPEVPLLLHELEITLNGSFTASGGFSVGPPGVSLGVLTSSGSRTQGQQITLPLSFVALSQVPEQSAMQRLAVLSGLPASQQRTETTSILSDRDALRVRIAALVNSWTPAACSTRDRSQGALFHPNTQQ